MRRHGLVARGRSGPEWRSSGRGGGREGRKGEYWGTATAAAVGRGREEGRELGFKAWVFRVSLSIDRFCVG
jgi:hypothetical protein